MRNLFFLFFLAFISFNCGKNNDPSNVVQGLPTITTTDISEIVGTTAVGGGTVGDEGTSAVTSRGICWNTASEPVVTGSHTTDGSGAGAFISSITDLVPGSVYHVRAYATNTSGTAYGNEVVFTASVPVATAGVYVAGFEYVNNIAVARLWKNGVVTDLVDGQDAQSVFVTATDVFVAGMKYEGTTEKATIWKNGVSAFLGDGYARAVVVSGTDVYVAGNAKVAGVSVPTIWKNGVATALPANVTYGGDVNSLFISGTDVYAAGWEATGSGSIAKLWKNGVNVYLTNTSSSRANSVFVDGTYVDVVGRINGDGIFWTNGTAVPGFTGGNYNFILTHGTDHFYGGNIDGGLAFYYKNGTATYLTTGPEFAGAESIFVTGNNDVYVSGYDSNGTVYVAKQWKNGIATDLSDGIGGGANGQCIFVKD